MTPALFSPRANRRMLAGIVLAAAAALGVPLVLMIWVRTPYARGQFQPLEQPVWFDHQHHVTGYRIDCRFCHSSVERSPSAGVPATQVCVACHNPVWYESAFFEPVRRSLATGRPIPWRRVHDLPDFVFFNHAIHVNKGVGCETCHGRVDLMPRIHQVAPLTMGWCLECHREPERFLRPVERMTAMGWEPERPQRELGTELVRRYEVRQLTDCTVCHR